MMQIVPSSHRACLYLVYSLDQMGREAERACVPRKRSPASPPFLPSPSMPLPSMVPLSTIFHDLVPKFVEGRTIEGSFILNGFLADRAQEDAKVLLPGAGFATHMQHTSEK